MELHQLKAFLAVARTGQLVRAAERLHLTQSALSKQIKGLEDELGVLLFSRTASGMTLTTAGQQLLGPIARTLTCTNEVAALAQAMQGSAFGELRLGTIIDPESIRLGPLLSALVRTHPQMSVSLVHGISGGLLRQIRDGTSDACFCLGTVTAPDIAVLDLHLEHYLVIGPADWSGNLQHATWSELATMPWIATPSESSQHGLVERMFAERGLTHQTVVEADQESSMIEMVKTGIALGLIRERIAAPALQEGSVVVWPGVRIPCPLTMIYLRANAGSPSWRNVRQQGIRGVSSLILAAKKRGYATDLDTELAASAMCSMLEYTCYNWTAKAGDFPDRFIDDATAIKVLSHLFINALGGNSASRQ